MVCDMLVDQSRAIQLVTLMEVWTPCWPKFHIYGQL